MTKATLVALLLLLVGSVWADEHNHVYEKGEEVVAWMDTVRPIHNRQETYPYYQLPFCHGDSAVQHHHETFGEALQGMDLINSGISIRYLTDVEDQPLCTKKLNQEDIAMFESAAMNAYWFTMFIDDLPISGPVGTRLAKAEFDDSSPVQRKEYYIFTHKNLLFEYNADRIISVKLQMGNPVKVTDVVPFEMSFSYSVQWQQTSIEFEDRFKLLLETDFFEHKVHWLSIFSSFMMVLFLTGLVSVILLRTIKSDYARYDREEGPADFDRDFGDDYGWKQVHGDVFRQPPRLMLLSAFMGTGSQLVILAGVVILYTIVGGLYTERATILTATVFLYAVTSAVAGFTSARYYACWGGKDWVKTVILTASLWPAMVVCVGGYINSVAIYYSSSRAIAFPIMLAMVAIWTFLCFPLTLLGAIMGRNWKRPADFPCRVNPIPRPIPEKVWYAEPLMIIALGGILPFGSIFIEIYFIFTSFWTYKIYYVYGFMLLVFCILLIVSACVAIVSTYFLLNSEDHRWHWVSFMTCASTSAYIYLYSIYYFFAKTRMTGLFQISFYFGYTALLSLGMFFMLGYVGHTFATIFVRRIYQSVKID
ncbi:hypothetical protein J3Q64DRAFT_1697142 [Phycomyces blakesleeanus]|uniref:Transmembrane 9 superfamily member n=2 Tax=Phycomyces blakesleeanus TaxID=4837 RepID=A0A162PNL3_PHYB8|nr:hypothetical protein PHYBLDRAFT_186833 [Phycomyces blakesleeanus NRRL 1555(-)]OAD74537.1 hypothetical protein PHYBLDRAFT_186833 [Phycomyces blakesleeanus NRRL 1555(-)]|eukprot:XP_018292577.1 hypothetical protein PHYBLDRAFT_186833 [Phycomyces blakesleeanus NRRL 1555(-)]